MRLHKAFSISFSLSLAATSLGGCGAQGASSGGSIDSTGDSAGSGSAAIAANGASSVADGAHRRCAWIFTSEPSSAQSFVAHADWFETLHPVWYRLGDDSVGLVALADADDPQILDVARQHNVAVMPLVAAVDDTSLLRAMLASPQKRSAHVQALVKLAQDHGYAGLDLDYEHLWDASDAEPLAAFIDEFSKAMHAAGLHASMAVPALDAASPTWDYAALGAALDEVHVMAYDFHTIGSSHAGPTAPLGWIDAVAARVQASGHADRFRLGLPNYGVSTTKAFPLGECAKHCTGPVATSTDEMASCPLNPNGYAAGRSLHCESDAGTLYFDDTASLEEKVKSAKAASLGGVGYWNVGDEPDGFFDMVKRYF